MAEEKKPAGLKIINFGFKAGDEEDLIITNKTRHKVLEKHQIYKVIAETENFITLDNGAYKETYNKKEIALGLIKIERVNEMTFKALPFTKEDLINLCKKYGANQSKETLNNIALELGNKTTGIKQISNCIIHWHIKEALAAEKNADAAALKSDSDIQNLSQKQAESIQENLNKEPKIETLKVDVATSHEEIEKFIMTDQKVLQKPQMPNNPTGKLKVTALAGQYCTYHFNYKSKLLSICLSDTSGALEKISLPFDGISCLIKELSNLNHNYIKRHMGRDIIPENKK